MRLSEPFAYWAVFDFVTTLGFSLCVVLVFWCGELAKIGFARYDCLHPRFEIVTFPVCVLTSAIQPTCNDEVPYSCSCHGRGSDVGVLCQKGTATDTASARAFHDANGADRA